MTNPSHHQDKLSKFLVYLLGRRPDEFGLVPDSDGFVRIKELLQALHEEQGWRHVRQAHLNEVLIVPEMPVIEIDGARIRARDTSRLPVIAEPDELPRLLFIAIRPKAYPAALERGLSAPAGRHLTLAADKDMALRVGRRADRHPTLLAIQVRESAQRGTCFQAYGQMLFLADRIYPGTFTGPPRPMPKSDPAVHRGVPDPPQIRTPGSYYPDLALAQPARHPTAAERRGKEPQWKKDRRQARRHKSNQRRPNDE
jgi:putative RNA 2'-phosphotransferase